MNNEIDAYKVAFILYCTYVNITADFIIHCNCAQLHDYTSHTCNYWDHLVHKTHFTRKRSVLVE